MSMENLPEDVILSHIDFSKNYTFCPQNQIQTMYWTSTQMTILVYLTYQVLWNSNGENSRVHKELHYYISDSSEHDTLMVQHCLTKHWERLVAAGFKPHEHWVWSYGCTGQFKGARCMYYVSRHLRLTEGCQMHWNFFNTSHGKGEWDGADGIVKQRLRQEQLRRPGVHLLQAAHVVEFLKEFLAERVPSGYPGMQGPFPIHRHFWLIDPNSIQRNRPWRCKTITGSRSFHSISSLLAANPTKLMVRGLSCFCAPCVGGDWQLCENLSHVNHWKPIRIQPKNPALV